MEFSSYTITMIVVGSLTWLVFILGIARFSKFYVEFTKLRKELNSDLSSMATTLKKLNSIYMENLIEQRNGNKIMRELLKKFEDTNVEIVEEPIPPEELEAEAAARAEQAPPEEQ